MRAKKLKTTGRDVEMMAEERLWRAVISRAIQEWVCGPLRLKREAEKYLFGNGKDFAVVCESAGMDAGRLRAGLLRFRECAADR
jgi:hypothetical protein